MHVVTVLALARAPPAELSCEVLVVPWRVGTRDKSPSQEKFQDALAKTIRQINPATVIVCGGAHPGEWKKLRAALQDADRLEELIATASSGMVVIGGRHDGLVIQAYRE